MGFQLLIALALGSDDAVAAGRWQMLKAETTADFRGLSVVSPTVAWVGGSKGTYGRTIDGGATWTFGIAPEAESLDFRDVEAFGADRAYLMSAGPGEKSRIYKTVDGGKTWRLLFKNPEPKGFLDAFAFWDDQHGIAFGDPIDGKFQLLVTDDGESWTPLPESARPLALPKEGAFAASGTCLVAHGAHEACFCTGGARQARSFRSADRGRSWKVGEVPIVAGVESAGAFSLAFRDRTHGVLVGGDYGKPDVLAASIAFTLDGGQTWKSTAVPARYRSCVAWAKDHWAAVGTSGSDVSYDDGMTWTSIGKENFNGVAFASGGEGFAVGPKGRIAKYVRLVK